MVIIEGDLLNAPFQVIAHQVNCMGVMGAGVAKSLRLKYPSLYESYKEMCSLYERNRKDLLGLCHWYRAGDRKIILNLFGQYGFGRDKRCTDYEAFDKAMRDGIEAIKNEAFKEDGIQLCIAIPYGIGCGLAGGDWSEVKEILEKIEQDENVLFFAYRLY